MNHIVTFTGVKFNPLEPEPEKIKIEDIAHPLTLACRANGHMTHFFSVAQHSINCAHEAKARGLSRKLQLACLLHDASEAYIGDIVRPMKQYWPEYLEIEAKLQNMIYDKYLDEPLTDEDRAHIDQIDDDMLVCEFAVLKAWDVYGEAPDMKSDPNLCHVDFKEIENEFIKLFAILIKN